MIFIFFQKPNKYKNYSFNNLCIQLFINKVSSLFIPPPAKCPETPGIISKLEFFINKISSILYSLGKYKSISGANIITLALIFSIVF